jgi:pilus assembly protein CpaE
LIEFLTQNLLDGAYEVSQSKIRKDKVSLAVLLDHIDADILIIDCNDESRLADLIEIEIFTARQPSTMVLLLSAERNATILGAAMQAGIREVLSTPLSTSDFLAALLRLSKRKEILPSDSKSRAKVAAFMSCKGGSGATFLATNFAYILAKKMNKNTIFLDCDLQSGDAVYYVSPGPGKSEITEITQQIERLDSKLLDSSVLRITKNLDLLSSPEELDIATRMTPSQFERLVNVASMNYDMVVLDLERTISPLTKQALEMADVVYLIMENLLPFLRDAKRIVAACRSLGYDDRKFRLVVNRYEKNEIIDIDQIENVVGLKVNFTIRSSFQDVAQAINTGRPIMEVNPDSVIVKKLQEMAKEFEPSSQAKAGSWLERLLGA